MTAQTEATPKDGERGLTGPSSGSSGSTAVPTMPKLSSRTLAGDVERVVKTGPEAYLSPHKHGRRLIAPRRADGIRCTLPAVGGGSAVVDVLLDNVAATLVVGPVNAAGTRVARVYSCVNAAPLTPSIPVPGAN